VKPNFKKIVILFIVKLIAKELIKKKNFMVDKIIRKIDTILNSKEELERVLYKEDFSTKSNFDCVILTNSRIIFCKINSFEVEDDFDDYYFDDFELLKDNDLEGLLSSIKKILDREDISKEIIIKELFQHQSVKQQR
jgi:hypothetical protein